MAQDRVGVAIQVGEVGAGVAVQREQGVVMMVMGYLVPERREETFRGVRLGIVGRGVDEAEIVPVLIDARAELLGATEGMDTQIIRQDHGHLATIVRTLDKVIDLATIRVGGAPQGNTVGEPAVAPIGGDESDDFGTLARGTDQTLAVMAFARPATGDRRMQTDVDLVLDVQIRLGQQAQQIGDIDGNLIPEIVIDEGVPIEGSGIKR